METHPKRNVTRHSFGLENIFQSMRVSSLKDTLIDWKIMRSPEVFSQVIKWRRKVIWDGQ